eukprot:344491-Alexandrium_andersonii.AAC.1
MAGWGRSGMPGPLWSIPELLDVPPEGVKLGPTEEPAGGSTLVPDYGIAGPSSDVADTGNA